VQRPTPTPIAARRTPHRTPHRARHLFLAAVITPPPSACYGELRCCRHSVYVWQRRRQSGATSGSPPWTDAGTARCGLVPSSCTGCRGTGDMVWSHLRIWTSRLRTLED
jgi:hypothetical protein